MVHAINLLTAFRKSTSMVAARDMGCNFEYDAEFFILELGSWFNSYHMGADCGFDVQTYNYRYKS